MTSWTAAHQAPLSSAVSQSLLKFMSFESVILSNHLILCCPLLLSWFFLSIRVYSSEPALCIRWPKHWSFSFSSRPSNEYWGLISFRIDWFDVLAVQGTQESFLVPQFQSIDSILWHSAAFVVQLSHPYMTTGKTIALTIRTVISKVMFLLFNMLSRFVITFLPRSKHLLISWLQSLSTVILKPRKIESVTASNFPPSICQEVMGSRCHDLSFFSVEFQANFVNLFHFHQEAL